MRSKWKRGEQVCWRGKHLERNVKRKNERTRQRETRDQKQKQKQARGQRQRQATDQSVHQ